ncbi:MAG: hypothetical protein QXQ37_06275 [Nitrososphaerota archaeon]
MATIKELIQELVKEAEAPVTETPLAFDWVDEVFSSLNEGLTKLGSDETGDDLIEISNALSKIGLLKLAEEYDFDLDDPNNEDVVKGFTVTGDLSWYGVKALLESEAQERDLTEREEALLKIAEDMVEQRPLGTSLVALYMKGIIDDEDLVKFALDPDEFTEMITETESYLLDDEDIDELDFDDEEDLDEDWDEEDWEEEDWEEDIYDEGEDWYDYDEDYDEEDWDEDWDEEYDDVESDEDWGESDEFDELDEL